MDAASIEAARAIAFRYLGYSARSQREIARRLEKAEMPEDDFCKGLPRIKSFHLTGP